MLADVLVLFGATGDLAQRKLYKALFELHKNKKISARFKIIGVSRRDWTDKQYRGFIKKCITTEKGAKNTFLERFMFHQQTFDEHEGYTSLANKITKKKPIFYLAIAPRFFPLVAQELNKHGVAKNGRLMFEKPFGNSLKTAQALNRQLCSIFKEEQIFRLDHYLGKESIQNLLVLRMANHVFESVWNRRHIDNVQISVSETIGIGDRGPNYFDKAGALQDMIQNHLLQILTYVAMEPPSTLAADDVQTEKVKILKNLKFQKSVFGQYGKGKTKAYTEEMGIPKSSKTETFVALKGEINNLRWQGVPFYLRTGKRLAKKEGKVTITFKQIPMVLFDQNDTLEDNQLVVRFQPTNQISFRFNTKNPSKKVSPVEMDFCHGKHFAANTPEAYEEILEAAIRGDKNLFTRWDEVEEQWSAIQSIKKKTIYSYAPGSRGPKAADDLLKKDKRSWQ